ncbi:MAG: ribulose-phosphate 3-epimerase [Candidatus Eremiobacteraeota bacterium]|nr:ribulose-phosphate 3-epimerase [Candidatus Eremiobacteraeota bacterium]
MKIAPSLLSADFARIKRQIEELESAGADFLHLDIMDGRFVPNITWGPKIVSDLRGCSTVPFDCHLMIVEPERYVAEFRSAGADIISFHYEATPHVQRLLTQIRTLGAKAGLCVCPSTPVWMVRDVIEDVDVLVIMSVNPGFGGQPFLPHSLQKIREARTLIDERNPRCELEVDGGVGHSCILEVARAGATLAVIGSGIFDAPNPGDALRDFRAQLQGAAER